MTNTIKTPKPTPLPPLVARGAIGGVLMGLANLVPGISGGTMLVAAGVYQHFINAIAEVTTLKFRLHSLILLVSVIITASLAILLLAGTVKQLVIHQRWVMYSLFIGLTLGGIPVIWRMILKPDSRVWLGAVLGFIAMAALAYMQTTSMGVSSTSNSNFIILLLAGLAAASAMILPGVSGGYLLLVLGQYVIILTAIDAIKTAIQNHNPTAMWTPIINVALPVGIGMIIGIVVVSQLLRWLLKRYELPTLGFLLGLLIGAVVGLWPFVQGVEPQLGDIIKGQVMTTQLIATLDPSHWPIQYFTPSITQIVVSPALIIAGFVTTTLVAWIGGTKKSS